MNRVGFYEICMAASSAKAKQVRGYFVQVYEAVMNFVCRSRLRNIERLVEVKESKPIVVERIKKEVQKGIDKFKVAKDAKKVLELTKEINMMKNKIEEFENQKKMDDRVVADLNKKNKKIELKYYKEEEKYNKLMNDNTKALDRKTIFMNKYKTAKTELETSQKENKQYREENIKLKKKAKQADEKAKQAYEKAKQVAKQADEKAKQVAKQVDEKAKQAASVVESDSEDEDSDSDSDSDSEVEVAPILYTQQTLNIRNVKELLIICRTKNISGYSKKSKQQLIDFMLGHKMCI